MSYYVVVPVSDEPYMVPVNSEEDASKLVQEIFGDRSTDEGLLGDWYIIGDGNCYTDNLPMNQYLKAMAGTAILLNNGHGQGFDECGAQRVLELLRGVKMSQEEADTHRPPDINVTADNGVVVVSVDGDTTEEGWDTVNAFMEVLMERFMNAAEELSKKMDISKECASDVLYLRSRSRHTPEMEAELIRLHKMGTPPNILEFCVNRKIS